MTRKTLLLAVLALTVLLAQRPAAAGTADAPTVKEIMKKANSPTGIYANLGQDLKDDNPSWPDVQQEAKDLAHWRASCSRPRRLAATRIRGTSSRRPTPTTRRRWPRRRRRWTRTAARAAWAKMGGDTCKTCHAAHRPPE